MTLVRWGLFPLLVAILVLAWGVWLLPAGWPQHVGCGVATGLIAFCVWFFRNPARTPQGDARCLTAPADGRIWDITELDEPDFIKGRALRIGIYLSVFDVHVNRSPVDGVVAYADYRYGAFIDVRHPSCADANERNTLGIVADDAVRPGLKVLVRQLTGLIARRIVCSHGVGDMLKRGELYGMIRFGSRTELWLPLDTAHEVCVKVGDRVKCGETMLVKLT